MGPVKSSDGYVATGAAGRKPELAKRTAWKIGGGRGLFSIIWPQRLLIMHRELPGLGALEPALWGKLQFLSERCAP